METNRKKKNKFYVTNEELVEQWQIWKESGDTPETRTIPDKLGEQMNSIAIKLLNHPNFNHYTQDMKDEMRQDGVLKQIKNLKNLDPSKGSLFAYLTQCAWTAFVVYLAHHYKQVNIKREMLTNALHEAQDRNDLQHCESMKCLLKELDQWQRGQSLKERCDN